MKHYLMLLIILALLILGGLAYLAIDRYGLSSFIGLIGVAGVAAIIFAESGLLIGFFFPGDSLLFTAGFLVHTGSVHFNIHWLALIVFLAAALGDNVGYAFGSRVGHRLFRRPDSLVFHKDNLRKAEDFYEQHGAKTILLARFVPVVRTFAPIVAGISKMRYRTFLTFNLIGALVWAAGLTYLGFFAGRWIEKLGLNIELVLILIVFLSILPPIIHILREPAGRRQIKTAWKRFKQRLFK
ncbi:MAG TPA: VTT domain-containing protein [Candidatus Saccharimonadales bacterium]|nr:VTT domain-containing protein [Candidatus Saccharimonadales bacterium]